MTEVQRLFLLLAAVAAYFLLRLLGPVLTPFVVAGILAYICDPLVDRLERWRIRRPFGVTLVIVGGIVIFLGCMLLLVPMVTHQVSRFAANTPAYLAWLENTALPWVEETIAPLTGHADLSELLRERMAQDLGQVTDLLQTVVSRLTRGGKSVVVFAANLLLTAVIFAYLLRDWDDLRERVVAVVPRRYEPAVRAIGTQTDRVMAAFLRGQLLIMLIVAVAVSGGLLALGLDLAIPIGMLSGAITFIPWVGSVVGATLSVLAALLQFNDLLHPAIALALFMLVQQIVDNLVTPRIMGNRIGVHPVAIILAVLAGGKLFGLFGMALAVPASALLKTVSGQLLDKYRASPLYMTASSAPADSTPAAKPPATDDTPSR